MFIKVKSEKTLEARKQWLQVAKKNKCVHLLYMVDNIVKTRTYNHPFGKTKESDEPMIGLDYRMRLPNTDEDICKFIKDWEDYLRNKKVSFKDSYTKML